MHNAQDFAQILYFTGGVRIINKNNVFHSNTCRPGIENSQSTTLTVSTLTITLLMQLISMLVLFIVALVFFNRVESVQLKIEDPEKITGSIISAGQGGFVKYWDTKQ